MRQAACQVSEQCCWAAPTRDGEVVGFGDAGGDDNLGVGAGVDQGTEQTDLPRPLLDPAAARELIGARPWRAPDYQPMVPKLALCW